LYKCPVVEIELNAVVADAVAIAETNRESPSPRRPRDVAAAAAATARRATAATSAAVAAASAEDGSSKFKKILSIMYNVKS
jgi:hypothetical protein